MNTHSSVSSKRLDIKQIAYLVLVSLLFLIGMLFLYYGMTIHNWHDFDVFYGAAKAALAGESIYIVTGNFNLPFWYFPWTAWLFIPYAIWTKATALILYKITLVLCAVLTVNSLLNYYDPKFKLPDRILVMSLIVPMSWQVMIVGQMEFMLLALLVITIYAIDQKKYLLAGLLFPFLWTKPHLLIIFTLTAFWLGKKPLIAASAGSSIAMLAIQTIISPGWHLEMLHLLQAGQGRMEGLKFTTLPSLLGSQENWVGTANLPFTILLILVAVLVTWRFRTLPTVPLLSLALAASLFCAPRAYAYDLPLLIPAMIWITARQFKTYLWLWFFAAILPPATQFDTVTYLIPMIVFLLGAWKAYGETNSAQKGNPQNQEPSEL